MTDRPLAGKIALITGAGRGIGCAIALAYAEAGAAVVCAARTRSEIEVVARQIGDTGGQALAVRVDVTDRLSVQQMTDAAVDAFGGLDILVINAGVNLDRRTVEESIPQDWLGTLDVNLNGAYYCAQAAIPHLKARGGGKIITIGSGMGHRGSPERSAYCVSKAGLWMLTRCLAQELWPFNISVNELIPGPVQTSMTADDGTRGSRPAAGPSSQSEWQKRPEDVVPLALFLATQPLVGPTAQSFNLMRRDG
ncbi:MAG: SDR family oxidoreductase [Caldilineaceae bacterium]